MQIFFATNAKLIEKRGDKAVYSADLMLSRSPLMPRKVRVLTVAEMALIGLERSELNQCW